MTSNPSTTVQMDAQQVGILDRLYRASPAERIPWHFETPPAALQAAIAGESERGRAIELGCGLGSNALYLGRSGFDVTGVDVSPAAIERARARADEAGLAVRFIVADLLTPEALDRLGGPFDLAVEWEVFHHIPPEAERAYIENVARLLRPGGIWLAGTLSVEDPWLADQGARRWSTAPCAQWHAGRDLRRPMWPPFRRSSPGPRHL